MKLEFFQKKFWTASRQVLTHKLTNNNQHDAKMQSNNPYIYADVLQCAALDGKCSISCDDEVGSLPSHKRASMILSLWLLTAALTLCSLFNRTLTATSLTIMASFWWQRTTHWWDINTHIHTHNQMRSENIFHNIFIIACLLLQLNLSCATSKVPYQHWCISVSSISNCIYQEKIILIPFSVVSLRAFCSCQMVGFGC